MWAQAPNDEWRRGSFDAMVAEPGQAASILSNPAGIKTKEQRYRRGDDKTKPGRKYDWIAEIASIDSTLSIDTWSLLEAPLSIPYRFSSVFSLLPGLFNILEGKWIQDGDSSFTRTGVLTLVRGLSPSVYQEVIKGTSLPKNRDILTMYHIKYLDDISKGNLESNTDKNFSNVLNDTTAFLQKEYLRQVRPINFKHYSRIAAFSYTNDENPLAWGFYFGLEQNASFRSYTESVSMSLSAELKGKQATVQVPVGFQAYLVAPLRVALATDFEEAIPGFTFGLGLKAVPFLGFNQTTWSNTITRSLLSGNLELGSELLINSFTSSGGLNLGLDFGVQYHFGSLLPELSFLHTGLKISDLLGFNIPFENSKQNGDSFRYALDVDWGIYAEHQFSKNVQVFGGFEIIQLRGLIPGQQNPYSALFNPVDHLRFQLGVSLFDNTVRFNLQHYNGNFSPGLMFNLGPLQLQSALNLKIEDGSWGFNLGLRFRFPHDGFNKRIPYKTYPKRKVNEKEQDNSTQQEELKDELKNIKQKIEELENTLDNIKNSIVETDESKDKIVRPEVQLERIEVSLETFLKLENKPVEEVIKIVKTPAEEIIENSKTELNFSSNIKVNIKKVTGNISNEPQDIIEKNTGKNTGNGYWWWLLVLIIAYSIWRMARRKWQNRRKA